MTGVYPVHVCLLLTREIVDVFVVCSRQVGLSLKLHCEYSVVCKRASFFGSKMIDLFPQGFVVISREWLILNQYCSYQKHTLNGHDMSV